jgi:hypothetical protein
MGHFSHSLKSNLFSSLLIKTQKLANFNRKIFTGRIEKGEDDSRACILLIELAHGLVAQVLRTSNTESQLQFPILRNCPFARLWPQKSHDFQMDAFHLELLPQSHWKTTFRKKIVL